MIKSSSFKLKESIFLLFIIIVFLLVIIVFVTEIIKNQNIINAKENFHFMNKELNNNIKLCTNKSLNWKFGGSCSEIPIKSDIIQYFNETKGLINPYDNTKGVQGNPGSVIINQHKNKFIFSIDVDANGGIDIEHQILFK